MGSLEVNTKCKTFYSTSSLNHGPVTETISEQLQIYKSKTHQSPLKQMLGDRWLVETWRSNANSVSNGTAQAIITLLLYPVSSESINSFHAKSLKA